MKKIIIAVLAGLVFLLFHAGAAYAGSLTVAVKQVNSDSAAQIVTCEPLQKNCVLPFIVNKGLPTEQAVNINVVYFTNGLALNFQTPSGYFYTDAMIGKTAIYNALWSRPLQGSTPAAYQITLFRPLSTLLGIPGAPNTDYSAFASLAITATPNP